MTSHTIQHTSELTEEGLRQRTAPLRFLIAGSVLLGVVIMNLVVLVQDWSTATPRAIFSESYLDAGATTATRSPETRWRGRT